MFINNIQKIRYDYRTYGPIYLLILLYHINVSNICLHVGKWLNGKCSKRSVYRTLGDLRKTVYNGYYLYSYYRSLYWPAQTMQACTPIRGAVGSHRCKPCMRSYYKVIWKKL